MSKKNLGSSNSLSNGILIEAFPEYLPDYSNPNENSYYFTYRIKITNKDNDWVKLISRHWVIINGNGDQEEVRGPGVVGKNPELRESESFEYSSYCPMDTEWGTMEGSYTFEKLNGEILEIKIPRFYLTITDGHKAPPFS